MLFRSTAETRVEHADWLFARIRHALLRLLRGADCNVDASVGVLTATLMALGAACLHAGWNLAVKRNVDSGLALWGQFFIAMFIAAGALVAWAVVGDGLSFAWQFTLLSGITHLPYTMLLARAYGTGDFSVAYPIARGGGATIMPWSLAPRELRDGTLKARRIDRPAITRTLYLVRPARRAPFSHEEEIRKFCEGIAARLLTASAPHARNLR